MLSKREEIASFLRESGYEIKYLADAYPKISWHVGHAIATPKVSKYSTIRSYLMK